MRQLVIEFDDEEIEMLEEQLQQIQNEGGCDTLEDYVYYATMTHCKTMKVASQMIRKTSGLDKMMLDENVHVGVINMPVQLANPDDKEEFSRFLNDVINNAVQEFNNRNNGQLN